ncbi:choice-of-anchor A family protein [[Clostridium] fimetarium]|uniref:Choice-of-anchor A domain-containing protein n=1 Tax=[Clostridium] fimetarium TaxID=99656 RepID=A0A1I0RAT2_9FIRM|nr:choice-of-anchor A family protein [[Clostridium] fimetarium]SEW37367.1 choice-of-anchor A domain-containing protein [[Clostridium] fimetarium]
MDNSINGRDADTIIGIPYKNINWEDIPGQPFGLASQFNLFVFGDANNIVDVEGAMAVGGSFYSPRSLSVGFEGEESQVPIAYSPDLVRYLVGDVISIKGPLGVIGHVVSGGSFRVAAGSSYYIGKNGSNNQSEELKYLYQVNGGSPYWIPSEKKNYYIISSYDVSRVIPASRISANVSSFFQNAKKSIETFKECIQRLNTNATLSSNSYEWVLSGDDPKQNVFTIDTRPNGIINKGIRFDIPKGSIAIVRFRTGPHAHLQSGLYGEKRLANNILYVFEDATDIHMENSSDIWGSILAPQAMFHGHPTGGHVSGNAALGGFAVNANSGFEFHLYPFVGGINCMNNMPSRVAPEIVPTPNNTPLPEGLSPINTPLPEGLSPINTPPPIIPINPMSPICPVPAPCPSCPEARPCPIVPPCPTCPEARPCPIVPPCPTCPEQRPCPTCPAVPEAIVCPTCPTCPEQRPSPTCPACPESQPCPTCPTQQPCPVFPAPQPCPTCPTQQPCPVFPAPQPCPTCPEQQPCPTCPTCPECPEQMRCPQNKTEYIPIPIPVPVPMRSSPSVQVCPVCEECLIAAGIISGCVVGCDCCKNHEWDVMLYQMVDDKRKLIYCITICHLGCFRFNVDYNGSYILKICPIVRSCISPNCRPKITFKNIGVASFTIQ